MSNADEAYCPIMTFTKYIEIKDLLLYNYGACLVDVAQLVRVPGCGPGGRGFESHYPPHKKAVKSLHSFFYSLFPEQ